MDSFSQYDEDVFVFNIFKKKKIEKGIFIEFGAWDGIYLSNCKLLADNNWSGFFIEGDTSRWKSCQKNYQNNDKITTINKFINEKYSLDNLISEYNINQVDVLSVDIDGKDLTTLKKLRLIKPKTIIIEFNSTIPFDIECEDTLGGNGSSYLSIKNYLFEKNYELIHVTNTNLVFIDKEFNQNEFQVINTNDIIKKLNPIRFGFNNFGEMFFIENKKIVKKEFYKFPLMKNFITFQPIPRFIRNMTDENARGYKLIKILYSNIIFLVLRPNLFIKRIFSKIFK